MNKFDPKHAKEHGYTKTDWDAVASPELTDDELATAQPLAEALPELAANMKRRGRPPLDTPKEAISIRLDADLLSALRDTGKGWRKGVNDMLRAAMGL